MQDSLFEAMFVCFEKVEKLWMICDPLIYIKIHAISVCVPFFYPLPVNHALHTPLRRISLSYMKYFLIVSAISNYRLCRQLKI